MSRTTHRGFVELLQESTEECAIKMVLARLNSDSTVPQRARRLTPLRRYLQCTHVPPVPTTVCRRYSLLFESGGVALNDANTAKSRRRIPGVTTRREMLTSEFGEGMSTSKYRVEREPSVRTGASAKSASRLSSSLNVVLMRTGGCGRWQHRA